MMISSVTSRHGTALLWRMTDGPFAAKINEKTNAYSDKFCVSLHCKCKWKASGPFTASLI